MNRYYSFGFDGGTQSIGKTEKKLTSKLLEVLPAHICLINSTWLGDDLEGLKEFLGQTTCTEAAVYSGPDWENRSEPGIRADAHKLLEDKFKKIHHIGNTNNKYYFSFWLEFIRENWIHFNKDKYLSEPKLARSLTVGNNGKHFLCYNRKAHDHRVSLLNKIHICGLQDYGIISATIACPNYAFKTPIILDETHDEETLEIINEWEYQGENDIISLGDAENWQRHFLTVVTETTQHTDVFISEKTFKPIIGLRPFIIYGDQNLYKKLKDWGFDVFEDMFPDILESLSHHDYEKRGDYIVEQLKILSGFDYVELAEKYRTLLPRLKANRARLEELITKNYNRISTLGEEFKAEETEPDINYAVDDYKKSTVQLLFDEEEPPAEENNVRKEASDWIQDKRSELDDSGVFETDVEETREPYEEPPPEEYYPPQPKKHNWQENQWYIGMPSNDGSLIDHEQIITPPLIVDKSSHDPNDTFYLWYDKLTAHPSPGNMSNRCLSVDANSHMYWWYDYAELNYTLMDIEKFNEKVHGKRHPLHNYYFVEIAYMDGVGSLASNIPDKVKDLARKRMIQIVFSFPHEGFNIETHWWMDKLTSAMADNDLTEIYSYFIFGDINFEKNYHDWSGGQNMSDRKGVFTKAFGYDYFQFLYYHQYSQRTDPLQVGEWTLDTAEEFIDPDFRYERETLHTVPTAQDKTHDLLNFNGTPRPHRMAIVSELHRLGYNENSSYISFLSRHYDETSFLTRKHGNDEYMRRWRHEVEQVAKQVFGTSHYAHQKEYLLEFFKEPKEIKLDVTVETLAQDDRYYDKKLYVNSYFSLVNETIFSEQGTVGEDRQLFITEKTYKPLMNYHPFIVVSLPYTLRYLRGQGFQTFPEMFDETYDSIKDPQDRFAAIINELKKWKAYSTDEKNERYNKVRHKLAFNKWHFLHNNKQLQLKARKKNMLLALHPHKND